MGLTFLRGRKSGFDFGATDDARDVSRRLADTIGADVKRVRWGLS